MNPSLSYETFGRLHRETRLGSARWLDALVLFQIACQLALLSSALGPLRVPIRSAAMGCSMLLLILLPMRGGSHPSTKAALVALFVICASLFHPNTLTMGGVAQAMMYLAILSPLFWVPRLHVTVGDVKRIVVILFTFHSVSSGIAIVQVYYPGTLQPSLSTATQARGQWYVDDLHITNANGERVLRPMGLSDYPGGGAATAGFYAVLFGLGLFLTNRKFIARLLSLAGVFAGLACLYLSMVRGMLVMLGVCVIALLGVLVWRGETKRVVALFTALVLAVALSFSLAIAVGGTSVTNRLGTLIESDAQEVYHSNRGRFLQETIEEHLPQYPLGAGLGRWGMMNTYFGDASDPDKMMIWAEIMWTGWLLDGGVPLVIAYVTAIGIAFWFAWKVAMRRDPQGLWLWASILIAYNVGGFAITFNYPFFLGQGGMELWMLNGALYGASRYTERQW